MTNNSHFITSRQRLNTNGVIGAWLFVLAPAVSSGLYAWAVSILAHDRLYDLGTDNRPMMMFILAGVCGLAFLGSCILLLTGRETDMEVRPNPYFKAEEPKAVTTGW